MVIAIVLYVIFCLLAGLAGSQRRMGFFGTFLLSLVITPLLVSLLLILTRPSRGEPDRSLATNRGTFASVARRLRTASSR
jgi:hypothetical protein